MPIKKHVVKAEVYVDSEKEKYKCIVVKIPETICMALGIGEGTPLKLYRNKNSYSFTVEVPLSYENLDMLNRVTEKNSELQEKNKELENSVKMLKSRVAELENML